MAFFDFLTGADEAAEEAEKATKKARGFEQEGRDKAIDILQPGANYAPIQSKLYDLSGINGGQAQETAFGEYNESPEVAFQREQGEQSAMRGAAASGNLGSGRTLADLAKFGQGVAQQGYGNFWSRLRDLYGSALGTAGQIAGIRTNSGSNLANITMQGGAQQAEYEGERGGVLGDLLSQGAALAGYIGGSYAGGKPGSSGSSYGKF